MRNVIYDELQDYQDFVASMWSYADKPILPKDITFKDDFVMTVGLGGETGEVLEVLKKQVRDGKFKKKDLIKELGDVQYYLTMIAYRHGISLREIWDTNRKKLIGRKRRKSRKASWQARLPHVYYSGNVSERRLVRTHRKYIHDRTSFLREPWQGQAVTSTRRWENIQSGDLCNRCF